MSLDNQSPAIQAWREQVNDLESRLAERMCEGGPHQVAAMGVLEHFRQRCGAASIACLGAANALRSAALQKLFEHLTEDALTVRLWAQA